MTPTSELFDDGRKAARTLHDKVDGGPGWYAGVTKNPYRRLSAHRVDPDGDGYAYAECADSDVARDAERILHSRGYESETGIVDDSAGWVYFYEITEETREVL